MSEAADRGRPAAPGQWCRITVAGPLSVAAGRALRSQFGPSLRVGRSDQTIVLDLDGLDQPAIRGLLTLLWDLGHDVVAVRSQSKERLS